MIGRCIMPHRGYRFVEMYKKVLCSVGATPLQQNPNVKPSCARVQEYYYPLTNRLNAAASY
jgi:hypothetical protein